MKLLSELSPFKAQQWTYSHINSLCSIKW